MHQSALLLALTASLSAIPAVHAGLYTSKSPVLQVDSRSYDRLIAKSNHTAIVEFYAPWCGHCQNLKPAYEKAAQNLAGLARVAAVDCDDDINKSLCGTLGVKGFPTLKIIRPGKTFGKPIVEDYQGARTASGIQDAVVAKIKDHVNKVKEKDVDEFLAGAGPKAILFTDKGTTSALLKSTAIDFLGAIKVGQVRDKERAVVERFGITKFPSVVLVPGEGQDHVLMKEDITKQSLVEFLKQAAEPNPEFAPAKEKGKGKEKEKEKKEKEKKKQGETKTQSQAPDHTPRLNNNNKKHPEATALHEIPVVGKDIEIAKLEKDCLAIHDSATTCVYALVPVDQHERKDKLILALKQLKTRAYNEGQPMFPLYHVPADVSTAQHLRKTLALEDDVELVVIGNRRRWWSRYEGDLSGPDVDAWIDSLRFGDGKKTPLPEGVLVTLPEGEAKGHDEL